MEKCEMHEYGLTQKSGNYTTCSIRKGTCPYDKGGQTISLGDEEIGVICNGQGLVKKAGLITNNEKVLRENIKDFKIINPNAKFIREGPHMLL